MDVVGYLLLAPTPAMLVVAVVDMLSERKTFSAWHLVRMLIHPGACRVFQDAAGVEHPPEHLLARPQRACPACHQPLQLMPQP